MVVGAKAWEGGMPIDRRTLVRGLAAAPVTWQLASMDRLAGWGDRLSSPGRRAAGTAGLGDLLERLTDLPVLERRDGRTFSEHLPITTPATLLAVKAPPGTDVAVRLASATEPFGEWERLHLLGDEEEGPDGEEAEDAGDGWQSWSRLLWAGWASLLQVSVAGDDLHDIEVLLIRDEGDASADAAMVAASVTRPTTPGWRPPSELAEPDVLPTVGGLRIVSRREWGANESWRGSPSYASSVRHALVHHTVNGNSYSASQAPGIVRSIYRYHTQTQGWKDIGYNALIDRYGVIYEGRYGGLDRPVIGAHAAGANAGSFGVALIGDFRSAGVPSAARNALLELLAAIFELHGIDPRAAVTANGRRVSTLAGHGDVGSTTCPGSSIRTLFPGLRSDLERRVNRGFSDISGHPHEANIKRLHGAGVTSGYPDGTFRPDSPVDRGQMATFLTRAAKLPPGGGTDFRDVTRRHPHHDGIAAVVAAGIADGYPDGTYRPFRDVTRGQMATFLSRALKLPERLALTFLDVLPTHPHWRGVESAAHAGVARGYEDGMFRPERAVTRGQMATFLVRAFDL
jgi:hypothetical protein